jgi:poly-gamma-glutamate synthesis protein (capsule biosynthesis protein)
MRHGHSRRRFLQQAIGLAVAGMAGCAAGRGRSGPEQVRITLAGQALMAHPLCALPYDGLEAVVAELRGGAAVFTDLEVAIATSRSGAPTRDNGFLHVAPAATLDCLQEMGFNLLALSNNHAWDLGTAGLLATREEVAARGFGFAGTGRDDAEATAAGFTPGLPRVGLVSAATGKIRAGAAATATRAGVNELRMQDGGLDESDVLRNLRAIAVARSRADYVIAYLHNHQWGEDMTTTKAWAREYARRCVDAGADVFVSHGAPLLHGIEFHRGRPLLHGLGSLVFQSRTAPGHYPPEVWESAIVHCDFSDGRLDGLRVVPVSLNEVPDDPDDSPATRGRPRLAEGGQRERVLERLQALSAGLGTPLEADAGTGRLVLP